MSDPSHPGFSRGQEQKRWCDVLQKVLFLDWGRVRAVQCLGAIQTAVCTVEGQEAIDTNIDYDQGIFFTMRVVKYWNR